MKRDQMKDEHRLLSIDAVERQRALFDAAPLAITMADLSGAIIDGNRHALELLGYDRPAFLKLDARLIIDEADRSRAQEQLKRVIAGDTVRETVYRIARGDGTTIEAELSASLLRDAAGAPLGILICARAVAVVAAATMALRHRDEEFRLVFEDSTDAIFWADTSTGLIINCNRQAEALMDRRRDEIIGMHQSQLHPPALAEELQRKFNDVKNSLDRHTVETEIITRTGTTVAVSITTSVVTVGDHTIIQGIFHDITARRQAERDLANRTSMLKALIETIPNPLFHKDTAGRYRGCNRAYEEFMGLSRDDLVGRTVYDMAPPEIARMYAEKDRELFENPGRQQYEWKVVRADGVMRDVIFFKATIHDEGGAVTGLIGVILDITELRAIERQQHRELTVTRALNRLYRPLVAHHLTIGDIIPIILEEAKRLTESEHGFVGTIDPRSGDLLPHTITDMPGDQCHITKTEGDALFTRGADGRYPALWGHALNSRQGFFTNDPPGHPASAGMPTGHMPLHNYLTVPVLLGDAVEGQIALANAAREYTEGDLETVNRLSDYFALAIRRIRDEAAMRESEEKFRALFENSKVGIIMADLSGRLLTVNRAFSDMTGYPLDELMNIDFRALAHPDSLPAEEVLLAEIFAGRRDSYAMEKRYITKDGRIIWVSLSISLIQSADGRPHRLVGVVEEITARKILERNLIDTRLAAENANRAKSAFLANMSHELRTPLNAILGFAQIMTHGDDEGLTEKQREYLRHIMDSGRHLMEMVNDILDLSRIEAGREQPTKRPFNLEMMLARAPASITSIANEKGIIIETAIDHAMGWLNGDEIRLKQVVYNLLANAITYTDAGRRIGIEARPDGDSAVITIWDEGIGIPESRINSIFDPFETVSSSRPGREPGAGLGLAISKRLVELHGGTILVTSLPGSGSRFTIILPGRSASPADGVPEPTRAEWPAGDRRMRILVVEDNSVNMTLMTETLRMLGYESAGAATGEAAMAAVRGGGIDLVLLDIQLPGRDGVAVLGDIRALRGRSMPVIAVTAYALKGDRDRYLEAGFDEYIAKPIDFESFRTTIAAVLEQWKGTITGD